LVNAVAFAGQLAFLREHLPWPLAGQVMMAVALESIAIYLAFHAHLAQLANDSALRLRLGAYGFALIIAACNYSHYAGPHWRPTFAAVAVALCSAVSPWLWGIHSRRASRDALLASRLIEPHALRLGPTRWLWHPLRSARVMWLATWEGIADPRDAVTRWESAGRRGVPTGGSEVHPESAPMTAPEVHPEASPGVHLESAPTGALGTAPPAALESAPGEGTRSAPRVRTRGRTHKRTQSAPPTAADAREHFREELARGEVPSQRRIKEELGGGWDRARQIHDVLMNGPNDDLVAELASLQASEGAPATGR
jgi:hypothetical protein